MADTKQKKKKKTMVVELYNKGNGRSTYFTRQKIGKPLLVLKKYIRGERKHGEHVGKKVKSS